MVLRMALSTTAAFVLAIGLGSAAMAGPERLDDKALDRVSAGSLGGLTGWFDLSEFDIDAQTENVAIIDVFGANGSDFVEVEQFGEIGDFGAVAWQVLFASSSGGSGSFASSSAFGSSSFTATRIVEE